MLGARLSLLPQKIGVRVPARPSSRVVRMASLPELTIWVKGNPSKGERGDCPFSHKALLSLANKGVQYREVYLDLNAKPEWYAATINAKGSVPTLIVGGPVDAEGRPADGFSGELIGDSGLVVEWAEREVPVPPLQPRSDEEAKLGEGFMGAFRDFLLCKDGEVEEKKSAFISQLQSLESFLSTHDGPFLGGDMMRQTDCRLAPQLYHSIVALKEFRGFDVLSQFPLLTEYFQAVQGTDAWHKTHYTPEVMVAGWRPKVEAARKA